MYIYSICIYIYVYIYAHTYIIIYIYIFPEMCRSSVVLHITKMSGWWKFVGSNSILWEVFFSGAGWDENVGGQTIGLNMGYTVYSIPPTGHWEDDAHPWDLGANAPACPFFQHFVGFQPGCIPFLLPCFCQLLPGPRLEPCVAGPTHGAL